MKVGKPAENRSSACHWSAIIIVESTRPSAPLRPPFRAARFTVGAKAAPRSLLLEKRAPCTSLTAQLERRENSISLKINRTADTPPLNLSGGRPPRTTTIAHEPRLKHDRRAFLRRRGVAGSGESGDSWNYPLRVPARPGFPVRNDSRRRTRNHASTWRIAALRFARFISTDRAGFARSANGEGARDSPQDFPA